MARAQIVVLLVSMFFLGLIVELIRRRRLSEKYALFWLFLVGVIIAFSAFPKLLFKVSQLLGFYYLTALFFISFVFLVLVVLYFSVQHSKLSEKNRKLTQEVGILGVKISQVEKKLEEKGERKQP